MSKSTRFYKSKDYKEIKGQPLIVRCAYQTELKKYDQIVKKSDVEKK